MNPPVEVDMTVENKTKEMLRTMQEEVVRLLREGRLTLEQVGRECRCSLSTVNNIARRSGLRRKDILKEVK
jgi:DNA-directed RNA polymerase specialized sigma24 family protein